MDEIREYLKRELAISDEEYYALVSEQAKKSPTKKDLNNIAQVESIQMQMIDNLGKMVSELLSKVNELEGKING